MHHVPANIRLMMLNTSFAGTFVVNGTMPETPSFSSF